MKKILSSIMILCLLTGMLVGCGSSAAVPETDTEQAVTETAEETEAQPEAEEETTEAAAEASSSTRILTFLPEEKPRLEDDFFAYENFDRITAAKIQEGNASWSCLTELDQKNKDNLSAIIRDSVNNAADYEKGTPEQKIAAMYNCVMDEEGRNKAGTEAIQPYLNAINGAESIDAYIDALCDLERETGFCSTFKMGPVQDDLDSSKYSNNFGGADLGLNKDYFVNESMGEYCEIYKNFIKQTWMNYGVSEAEAEEKMEAIFDFQNSLAKVSLDTVDKYSLEKYYNPVDLKGFQELLPGIDVEKLLNQLGYGPEQGQSEWIIVELEQTKKLSEYLTEENLPLLKDYSTFVLLRDCSNYMSMDYQETAEAFNNAMRGIEESKPREKQAEELVQGILALDFGKIYAEQYFSSESKADIEEMVAEIIEVYRSKIESQTWMSDETKEKAKKKLDKMVVKIGYPDKWPTYLDGADIKFPEEGGSLLENQLELSRCGMLYNLSKVGKPVDREEWMMTPQTVNAYYNPSNNEIVFPAGILQAPYYDKDAERAANIGGIGIVIGHEISHAFDSTGSLYDENGNYNIWWSEEEYAEFEKRQQSIIDYYSQYELIPGQFVNGSLTLTENIADLGSMSCACEICGDDKEDLQLMFENFATIFATKQTEAIALNLLNNDTHSPGKIRVNALLSATDDFYEVFDIKESDQMYVAPENRVGIW